MEIEGWGEIVPDVKPEVCTDSVKSVQTSDEWTTVKKPLKVKKASSSQPCNKIINCTGCSTDFLFTVDQQITYMEREWAEPKICDDCKSKRYMSRMSDFPKLEGKIKEEKKEVLVGKLKPKKCVV